MTPPSPVRRIGRGLSATAIAAAGIVAGWLVVKGVLALPLPEGALFGLSGLAAIVLLAGAAVWKQLWGRALLVGAFIGIVVSIVLVLLIV
jgi:hypothetical protein